MTNIRFKILAAAGSIVLAGCQNHLPPLEEGADSPRPKVTDAIDEIQCELATIVNTRIAKTGTPQDPIYKFVDSDNATIKQRATTDPNLAGLIQHLIDDHFVASAQLTLEVTDTEGLTPSLSFMNTAATWSVGIGGQLNGTEDRSLNVNYVIDLASLQDASYRSKYCGVSDSVLPVPGAAGGPVPTIAGDLGLGDIVADGLTAVDESKAYNLYSGSGPTPPTVAESFSLANGQIQFTGQPAVTIQSFAGSLVVTPQATGAQTLGTVTLNGLADIVQAIPPSGGHPTSRIESKFVLSLSGSLLPPNGSSTNTFTLTGMLEPVVNGSASGAQSFVNDWGFSPALSLTGSINNNYDTNTLKLTGIITAAAGSAYATSPQPGQPVPPGSFSIGVPAHIKSGLVAVQLGAPTPPGGGKGASSANSSGTTSFGSLVDFTLVYGLNGGPNWSFKRVKGPSGSTPLISLSRSHYDSLSITFVAACQISAPATIANYWDSIGNCNQAHTDAASAAYQAGTLQILKNLLQKSGASITP
jgi:hypothetical protein